MFCFSKYKIVQGSRLKVPTTQSQAHTSNELPPLGDGTVFDASDLNQDISQSFEYIVADLEGDNFFEGIYYPSLNDLASMELIISKLIVFRTNC